jgi:hypothetical protein
MDTGESSCYSSLYISITFGVNDWDIVHLQTKGHGVRLSMIEMDGDGYHLGGIEHGNVLQRTLSPEDVPLVFTAAHGSSITTPHTDFMSGD